MARPRGQCEVPLLSLVCLLLLPLFSSFSVCQSAWHSWWSARAPLSRACLSWGLSGRSLLVAASGNSSRNRPTSTQPGHPMPLQHDLHRDALPEVTARAPAKPRTKERKHSAKSAMHSDTQRRKKGGGEGEGRGETGEDLTLAPWPAKGLVLNQSAPPNW